MKYCLVIVAVLLLSCGKSSKMQRNVNDIARDYVILSLETGKLNPDYVDAYFGPDSLKALASKSSKDINQIHGEFKKLLSEIKNVNPGAEAQRIAFLKRHIEAAVFFAEMQMGQKKSFDEQSKALYGAEAPEYPEEHYQNLIKQLDSLLPGNGSLQSRVESFKKQFYVPQDKVPAVYEAAINEARKRTKAHVNMPENEKFTIAYVTGKPWEAYNWFKGNSTSLIEINTGLPVNMDYVLVIAAYEGYPGHHLFHNLIEQKAKKEGWIEHTVYPLFSPASLVSEGLANYGIEVAFPGNEKLKFEKEVLYPLAGLDTSKAVLYEKVNKLLQKLTFAGTQADKYYFDKKFTREQAVDYKMKYQLRTRDRAERSLDFTDKYGAYVINYNVGLDIVRRFAEAKAKGDNSPQKKWQVYIDLISNLRTPEQLQEK